MFARQTGDKGADDGRVSRRGGVQFHTHRSKVRRSCMVNDERRDCQISMDDPRDSGFEQMAGLGIVSARNSGGSNFFQ